MCKRNSPDKNEASIGCSRETPEIKNKNKTNKNKTNKQNQKVSWDV